jgi:hypothetical protein
MPKLPGPETPRMSSWLVAAMVALVSVPAALTLHTVRVSAVVDVTVPNPSPYGYTVSLLLFVVPIVVIGFWFLPQERVKVSKTAFWITIGLLFPMGAVLDFFFAHLFLTFPNSAATLRIIAPALGGGVPIEEYLFYFTGFVAVLLIYIWFDEYWLSAYSIAAEARERSEFERLLRFHPASLILAVVLIGLAIAYKKLVSADPSGFPGYFTFLTLGALLPSAALLPTARPMINWRALSLTLFMILLTSLMWEATLGVPYGWWGYQPRQMMGLAITAWARLPIEAVLVWMVVTYTTVIVYEIVKRWKSSGRHARSAFLG